MLLGEYIYGGHWPLDFGSLESDDYTATKNALQRFIIARITSEREARSEFLLIYTKNLSMSGRPAGRPAGRGHAFERP